MPQSSKSNPDPLRVVVAKAMYRHHCSIVDGPHNWVQSRDYWLKLADVGLKAIVEDSRQNYGAT